MSFTTELEYKVFTDYNIIIVLFDEDFDKICKDLREQK